MTTSETTTSIPGAESNADGVSTDSDTDTPEAPNEPQKGNKEARYRVERNEAREELVTANARIERMQRAEVERLATEAGLSHGSDVFTLSGNGPADYLDDHGNVDSAKVAADVAAVLEERPGLRKNAPAFDPTQGTGGGKPKAAAPSWESMFSGSGATPNLYFVGS
ncbi:hypothetical protein RHA1_ro06558 [Rhodococcus jostii RHA1]|uniref:Scaffolding protein n=1 Tax=Rhodococcus jostii (strain RHA1) TaxID=101510 RepID=Q0S2A5_RHOJR|nr:hypothetical protein [Rhodococcus jostii]ABG98331.1 hypothetical protein RHA1_ro06558 [Rhodococcus jostii RHA1]